MQIAVTEMLIPAVEKHDMFCDKFIIYLTKVWIYFKNRFFLNNCMLIICKQIKFNKNDLT